MDKLNIKIDPKTLECSLCLGTVSDPRVLPCGHTFCGLKSPDKCLRKLDPRNTGTIKCANCQTDHQVKVADVPPNINCKEMLESLDSKKQGKRLCQKHGEQIVMRCKIDGEKVCVTCVTGDHCGHEMEKIHKHEHKQLSDFWAKENAKFEDTQQKCRDRKNFLQEEADYIANQLQQEDSLDNQLRNLITGRDAIKRKLDSDDFNPDDEEVLVLQEYMDQLEAICKYQQEASQDVRERSRQLIELIESRTTEREGGSTGRRDVGRRTLAEENLSCTTNILALGRDGEHYILGLTDGIWKPWNGKRTDFDRAFEAICYKGKVYIIGGLQQSWEASSKVDIFHFRESKWNKGPRLNNARWDAAACLVQSKRSIYICGGSKSYDARDALVSVEKLELDKNDGSPVGEWREVTPMKEKRNGSAAVAVSCRLFVMGGFDQNVKSLSSVEIFDTETEEWIYGPQMKQCRSGHAVEHYDGFIYAVGGKNGTSELESCEKLHLQSMTWTSIESMRVPRSQFGSIVANGKIYVVGGYTKGRKDDDKSVEIYDPVTNTWSRGPRLPTPLKNTECVSW